MPKLFGKDVPTWMIGLAVLLGVVLIVNSSGDDGSGTAKPAPKKAAQKKNPNDIYLPIDYKVRFAGFTEPVQNSFKPLVAKMPGGGVGQTGPAGISSAWAGGEANWGYTGYLVVNGGVQGLLEKSDTGEGDYVTEGERWKGSLISRITPDSMTLVADDGPHQVKLGDGSEQKEKTNVVAGTVTPVNPAAALQGAIGGQGLAQQGGGINPADMMAQPDPSAFPNMGGNGGGRRRGGRGGRGGGGGFGGGGFGGG